MRRAESIIDVKGATTLSHKEELLPSKNKQFQSLPAYLRHTHPNQTSSNKGTDYSVSAGYRNANEERENEEENCADLHVIGNLTVMQSIMYLTIPSST